MSADKHRSLARRTAYLRLAASRREIGFAVQIKWGYAITPDVAALEELGYLHRSRNSAGGRKRVTWMVITPAGRALLQETLARRGQDFGPVSLIRTIDPRKIRKDERRKAAAPIAGYTSRRVYFGTRTLDAPAAARHVGRVRRAVAMLAVA
jgi:DNA-binding MarR family transcriptional regulator